MNKRNRKKSQNAKSATGEECKTKTLQGVKVQHEIVKYIKRRKKEIHTKKRATWK